MDDKVRDDSSHEQSDGVVPEEDLDRLFEDSATVMTLMVFNFLFCDYCE